MSKYRSFFILGVLLFFASEARADVDLLVKAEPIWMESIPENEKARWPQEQKDAYEARSVVGDIIVVRETGWTWGREENLPRYVIIRVTGMNLNEAKRFEERLEDDVLGPGEKHPKLLKKRKWQVPVDLVDAAKANGGRLTVTRADLLGKVKEKKKPQQP